MDVNSVLFSSMMRLTKIFAVCYMKYYQLVAFIWHLKTKTYRLGFIDFSSGRKYENLHRIAANKNEN